MFNDSKEKNVTFNGKKSFIAASFNPKHQLIGKYLRNNFRFSPSLVSQKVLLLFRSRFCQTRTNRFGVNTTKKLKELTHSNTKSTLEIHGCC